MKIDMTEYENAKISNRIDKPTAGAYEFVITAVEDTVSSKGNAMLKCECDIASGEFKDYAADTAERAGFWPLAVYLTYGGKALGLFKRNMQAIESANTGFKFDGNERKLIHKHFFATLSEEHYRNRNGYDDWGNKIVDILKAIDYEKGNFKVPEPTYKDGAPQEKPTQSVDPLDSLDGGELPF